jgi:signal transduction histidine kinase
MTRRLVLMVATFGVGAAWLAAAALGMPASEALRLALIAGGAAVAVGSLGVVFLTGLRRRSLAVQIAIVSLVSVVAAGVGSMVAAAAMFISDHDRNALVLILIASGTTGVLVAAVLGHRASVASGVLRDAARRIGRGDVWTPASSPPTGEFAELARELETMSRKLEEAHARERALDTSRRELTAWVSHDLRTPLAGIRAIAEALEDRVVTDPETVARYHRTLRIEADRLARLVDELFELSVIHAGALRLQMERVSLGDLVSDALASAAPSASARGVRLDGSPHGASPAVDLSPSAVTRVLRNLLDNAIRYTPSDGSVWIETGVEPDAVYVSVADECGGIAESELDRVFEPAFRGEPSRTPEDDGGAGLGLAIARGIVEAHHGEISVRNEGAGCRFTVRLPVSQARPAAPSVSAPGASA